MGCGCIIGCCMCPVCWKSPAPAPLGDNDLECITCPEQIEEIPATANSTTLCEAHFTENQFYPLTMHNCDAKCTATPSVFCHMAQEQGAKQGIDHASSEKENMPPQDGSQNNAHIKVTSQCFKGLCSREPLTSLATMQVSSATKPGQSLLKPKVCASRLSLGQVPQLPGRSVSKNGFDLVCANPGQSLLKRHQASNLQQDGQPVTCSMHTAMASFHHIQPGQSLLKEHWAVHAPNMKLNRQPATRALGKTEILPGQSVLRQQQVNCVQSPKQNAQPPASTLGKRGLKIGTGQSLLKRKQEPCDLNPMDSQSIVPGGITRESSTTSIGQGQSLLKSRAETNAETEAAADILNLKRRLSASQRRVSALETENRNLKAGIAGYLGSDQALCLQKGTMRGTAWSTETVVKALKLKLSCRSQGYNVARELGMPLPSERTLQRKLQGFKFAPGLLFEVIDLLKIKMAQLSLKERHAVLMLDEMQISKGLDFDSSTGTLLGKPTIPLTSNIIPESCYATHALVFMLGGISTRWKQTAAYEFTGHSFRADVVKEKVSTIISACENAGVIIHAVVTDMGPCNQALWRLFGITVTKKARKCHAPHPCDSNRRLYFIADAPHVLKNLRGHFTRGHKIHLPEDIVERNKLPTAVVSTDHVEQLLELEEDNEFRLAPKLTKTCLSPGHYEKMKVGPAYSLIHHDTAAALYCHVEKGNLERDAQTTAWFFDKMHTWFTLITSRTRKQAERHLGARGDAFLQEIIGLIEAMKIEGGSHGWKPVQTGTILTTMAAMELQEHLVVKEGFHFVLLSRLGQDALENFFSTIRMKNPIPSPREFKSALRTASLAQFLRWNPRGNYERSDAEELIGFPDKIQQPCSGIIYHPAPQTVENMELDDAFLYVCGYAVRNVKKNCSTCQICADAITGEALDAAENKWLRLKSYLPEKIPLESASKAAQGLLKYCEASFKMHEQSFLDGRIQLQHLTDEILKNTVNAIPTCHDVPRKLVNCFLKMRMHIFCNHRNETIKKDAATVKCSSRSIGMHQAAQAIR
ncbi:uncharacterized protein LOC142592801 isoform X2 [Dermacentor variabilis]|uniref:uncharacterized protein LOC142592801 isoform X2 n=1 Tax=Dermacentor variabilis TaxID=34621 RepID=UPI003F5B8A9E